MRNALVLVVLLGTACSKKGDDCAVSVGTCNPNSIACGIQLACKDHQIQLKCTPPAEGAKTMACECVDNNVIGKKVEVTYPWQGDAKDTIKTACDLKL